MPIYPLFSSGVMRDNIVKEERHQLPKECRQQVRSQLFQQRENIDFDPHLKEKCAKEIRDICKDVQHGSGQVNRPNASVVESSSFFNYFPTLSFLCYL